MHPALWGVGLGHVLIGFLMIVYFNTIREVYPGNSSYEIQTGGVLKNLRESTTIEKVWD